MKAYITVGSLLSTLIFFSCMKDATTSPSFVYKKGGAAGAVLSYNGEVIKTSEFNKGIENDIYELEEKLYDLRMNRARGLILEKLVDKEKGSKKMTNDQWLEKEVISKVEVSAKDIEAFIVERKIPKVHVNDQLKGRVKKYLIEEKKKDAISGWLDAKLSKNPVSIFFKEPIRPVFDIEIGQSPVLGAKSAPVTIVEYSDFQCPYCAKGSTLVHDLKKKYGKKINVVFKNFPLDFHRQAKTAAMAGLCANEQGTQYFWKLHDHMFENQNNLKPEDLESAVEKINGLNKSDFSKCLKENKYLAQVEMDINSGKEVGVKSTPTFFVNGKIINGAQPIEVFSELIDKELN
jgi:predicted DsbA family dithiol-disulfide isomerase